MRIPPMLEAEWRRDPDWLAALPCIAAEYAERWELALEEPFDTPHSLVVPAGDVVLKLNAPAHREAQHEAEALARWDGQGAVRLIARDDDRRALVIERCRPGTRLLGGSARRAQRRRGTAAAVLIEPSEPHPFRSLADEAERWSGEILDRYERAGRPFERSLVDLALAVLGSVDPSARFLVNQDLHGGNILRATREPWLVIDPKPLVGERELNGVGLLRNAAMRGGSTTVRRWLVVLTDLGLDRERLRRWALAHALAWGWSEERGWASGPIETARAIASR